MASISQELETDWTSKDSWIRYLVILPSHGDGDGDDDLTCSTRTARLSQLPPLTILECEPLTPNHSLSTPITIDNHQIMVSARFAKALLELRYTRQTRHILTIDIPMAKCETQFIVDSLPILLKKSEFLAQWVSDQPRNLEKMDCSFSHGSRYLTVILSSQSLRYFSPNARKSTTTNLIQLQPSNKENEVVECKTILVAGPDLPVFTAVTTPPQDILRRVAEQHRLVSIILDGQAKTISSLEEKALRKIRNSKRPIFVIHEEDLDSRSDLDRNTARKHSRRISSRASYTVSWRDPESVLDASFDEAKLHQDLNLQSLIMIYPSFPSYYHRKPINISVGSSEIRLLAILPRKQRGSGMIHCQLERYSLNGSHPPYWLLSMVQNSYPSQHASRPPEQQDGAEIVIDGSLWVVTKSLEEEMRFFQNSTTKSYMWTQPICVNDLDKAEVLYHTQLSELVTSKATFVKSHFGDTSFSYLNSFIFTYPKIDSNKRQIRLLKLRRSPNISDPIICDLAVKSLDVDTEYYALSYCWGKSRASCSIHINGALFYITFSVETALQSLRPKLEETYFWIDAICINQNDSLERSQQVTMMADIYSQATEVIAWLGPAINETRQAFQLFKEIAQHQQDLEFSPAVPNMTPILEKILTEAVHDKKLCISIYDFFKRQWWERLWILQEATLARKLQVCSGTLWLEWEIMERAIVVFHGFCLVPPSKHEPVQMFAYLLHDRLKFLILFAGHILGERAYRPLDHSHKPLVKNTYASLMHGSSWYGTVYLLELLRNRKYTDARDIVYSTLGLANDSPKLLPDYSKSVMQVYKSFAKSFILQQQNLDILVFNTFSQRRHISAESFNDALPSWPSWVPDWRVNSEGTNPRGGIQILAQYSALDTVQFSNPLYNASKGSAFKVEFSNYDKVMQVEGFQLGSINRLLWVRSEQPGYGDSFQDAKQEKTIAADEETHNWHMEASRCPRCASLAGPLVKCTTLRSRKQEEPMTVPCETNPTKFPDWVTLSFVEHIYQKQIDLSWAANGNVSHNVVGKCGVDHGLRCIFQLGDSEIGGGPEEIAQGDIVCIIYGSFTPFVLRPCKEYYLLVGTCYVPGYMQGQAMQNLDKSREQKFLII